MVYCLLDWSMRVASAVINCWRITTSVKYHKGRKKAIKDLNSKIPTDPYKRAIFPVGIPYSLQNPKNPYRRYFSLRVATVGTTAGNTACNYRTPYHLVLSHKTYQNQRICYVTIAYCYVTKRSCPATLKMLGRPAKP